MHYKNYFINCSDVDEYKKLKPSAFFKIFQDLAVESTEVIGFGHTYLDPRGLTWVITRVNVEFEKVPDYQQTIKIVTYPSKAKSVIYPRHFFITDQDKNVMAKMSSTWALVKLSDHSVSFLDADEFRLDNDQCDIELPLPRRIKESSDNQYVDSRLVRFSDIDLNTHLNNTRYIDFIFDLFDADFYKENIIKKIQVDYLSEIKEKEKVDLFMSGSNPYQVVGKVKDKACFIASLLFEKRQ